MNLYRQGNWKLTVFEDCPAIYTSRPPCWFFRFMQRWLLGFRWTRE